MEIEIHRIYEGNSPTGYRVLVDKLWPRGISKSEAKLDDWWKDFAPNEDLRKWFDHDSEKWADFRKKYLQQLSKNKSPIKNKLKDIDKSPIIFLYGAKNEKYTHAKVLSEYINKLKI